MDAGEIKICKDNEMKIKKDKDKDKERLKERLKDM